jgi:saccharopine dehydrogenase-like NADP-dependent oxidoreductase
MRVAVLGAGGSIGSAIVRDLAESDEFDEVVALDRDGERARFVAQAHGSGKTPAATVEAEDRMALMLVLEGVGLLVNAASHRTNIAPMEACLAVGCGYLDLGAPYEVTERQLGLDGAFAVEGLLAVVGCGAAPGKTNLMALHAARELDVVESVRCASTDTIADDVTVEPTVVRSGVPVTVPPLTAGGWIVFPDPIGERGSIYMPHAEVLTLPASLAAEECDFRLALLPAADATAPRLSAPSATAWSAQRVDVAGTKDGRATCVTVTALTGPHERWRLAGGIVSAGSVAAAAARLYARGALGAVAGVRAPEAVLPPEPLFEELEARGCAFASTVGAPSGEA